MIAVAFTAFNRPRYLAETLASWERARGIDGTHLVFRCEPGCPEVADMCDAVAFAPRTVIRNPRRLGVLANPWHALNSAFTLGAGFAVLAEDDLIVSADVIEYLTWCAERYRDDPGVLAVTTHQREEQPGGLAGVRAADWGDPDGWHFWVWGTWRDRWERLLRPEWDFTYEENGGGPAQRGWDWKIRNHWVTCKGMRVIAPSLSRSQHIGRDGIHASADQFEELASRCFVSDVPPQRYQEA